VSADALDGHPGIEYLHRHWTGDGGPGPTHGRSRLGARIRRVVFAYPRRAVLPERELVTQLASLTDALELRCRQLAAEIEDLRVQLAERDAARAVNDAKLAGELDAMRRRGG
jgi:hypothetical protein